LFRFFFKFLFEGFGFVMRHWTKKHLNPSW